VWLHEVGTDAAADARLFHEPDERYWVGAGFTRSEKYLVIEVGSSITTEEYLVDATDLRSEPRSIWPRREGVEYSATHAVVDGEDVLYIVHNDGALDFELVRVAASDPQGQRDVVLAHTPGRRVLDMSAFRDWGSCRTDATGCREWGSWTTPPAASTSSPSRRSSTPPEPAAIPNGPRPWCGSVTARSSRRDRLRLRRGGA
jgi:protease II